MKALSTPIKRSEELAPLSREHHEDLLFAWKIRQGIKFGVSEEVIVSYCNWFWKNHMEDHFQKEEQAFATVVSVEHPMMAKMLDDHEAIKLKLKQLSEFPSAEGIERLAQIVTYHVRFEEREFFNYIEQIATEEQLNQIHELLKDNHFTLTPWNYTFWLKAQKQ